MFAKRKRFGIVVALFIILLTSSCGSSKKTVIADSKKNDIVITKKDITKCFKGLEGMILLTAVLTWIIPKSDFSTGELVKGEITRIAKELPRHKVVPYLNLKSYYNLF